MSSEEAEILKLINRNKDLYLKLTKYFFDLPSDLKSVIMDRLNDSITDLEDFVNYIERKYIEGK